jgi:hypothetical protein
MLDELAVLALEETHEDWLMDDPSIRDIASFFSLSFFSFLVRAASLALQSPEHA